MKKFILILPAVALLAGCGGEYVSKYNYPGQPKECITIENDNDYNLKVYCEVEVEVKR